MLEDLHKLISSKLIESHGKRPSAWLTHDSLVIDFASRDFLKQYMSFYLNSGIFSRKRPSAWLACEISTDCFRIMKTIEYTSLSFEQWEYLHVNVHPLGLHVGLSQVFKRMKMREITKK